MALSGGSKTGVPDPPPGAPRGSGNPGRKKAPPRILGIFSELVIPHHSRFCPDWESY